MRKFNSYKEAEKWLTFAIVFDHEFITPTTQEILGTGFKITDPTDNKNDRSNYEYADEFFKWLLSGDTDLSQKLVELNPWVKRFVDTTGLPENFSASYGDRIHKQIAGIRRELEFNSFSRRGYIHILYPDDKVILTAKTTHEYPCTIGFQLFIRDNGLNMVVNMRSNNVYAVMPYDVYNFTKLQQYLATDLNVPLGNYYHQINNAHIFKGDVRRIKENGI